MSREGVGAALLIGIGTPVAWVLFASSTWYGVLGGLVLFFGLCAYVNWPRWGWGRKPHETTSER